MILTQLVCTCKTWQRLLRTMIEIQRIRMKAPTTFSPSNIHAVLLDQLNTVDLISLCLKFQTQRTGPGIAAA